LHPESGEKYHRYKCKLASIQLMLFHLRPWSSKDLNSLVKFANNYNIARNLMDVFPYPYSVSDGKAFIKMAAKNSPPNILAIEVNDEAAGAIAVQPQNDIYRKNAEMGYWLAEPYWGKGIMTRAITQMVDYGFKNWNIDRIYARPFGHNIASQKALEKAGFVLEARLEKTIFKNGEYIDELIYAIRRSE
jgi:RimJ/RimL family protein N-acetyltransferase